MTTSAKLLNNKQFVESCFQHKVTYPKTTRKIYKGIPVEIFDNFSYDDVMFTISEELYNKHIIEIKHGQKEVRSGAMKWIEQIIYEYTKQNDKYPYWCIPKMKTKGGKPRYIKTRNQVLADCMCEANISVCETKLV